MTHTNADTLLTAITDAEDLARHLEPNADVLQDPRLDALVQHAMSGPVAAEYAVGVPLLHFANGNPAVPLVEAILAPPIPRQFGRTWYRCDVEGTRMQEPHTLWVPCGASYVQVTVRNHVRNVLEDLTGGARLVWW